MTADRLDKMEGILDRVKDSIHSIDKTLAEQATSIKDQFRRAVANDKRVSMLEKRLFSEIKPLKAHVEGWNYMLKVMVALGIILGVAVTGLQIYDRIVAKSAQVAAPLREAPQVNRKEPNVR